MSEKNERIYAAYERICKERDNLLAAAERICKERDDLLAAAEKVCHWIASEQIRGRLTELEQMIKTDLRAAIARAKGE